MKHDHRISLYREASRGRQSPALSAVMKKTDPASDHDS
jgi:hypothetical protein